MSESIQSPLPTLTELSSALQTLQSTLDPLLSRPLAETLAKLEASLPPPQTQTQDGTSSASGSNDPSSSRQLDSAKLRTSIAYVLLDLVWIHLRLKGVDPHTHPVAGELKRVQGYFVKIRNVEKAGPGSGTRAANANGEQQRLRLDGAAAKRMVKGAIAEGAPAGRHTKFGGDGEQDFSSSKAGKAKEKGQRRATKDPFDGYGDDNTSQGKGKGAAAAGKDEGSSKKTTAKKRHSDEALGGEASGSGSATTSVDSSGGDGGASKHQKKKQKKQRRA